MMGHDHRRIGGRQGQAARIAGIEDFPAHGGAETARIGPRSAMIDDRHLPAKRHRAGRDCRRLGTGAKHQQMGRRREAHQ